MRVLSLFSGGGLGDYGLTLAGMEIVGQVEIDDYCQKILKLRWPDVPKWKDIREVKGADVIKACGAVDLISGGFPCQPFSTAGNRTGETDKRHLWPEMHRLICEIKPRWVLAENVSGLLSISNGWVFGEVVRNLASSGYVVQWDCIPASAVNAPHQRDRVWIVGHSDRMRESQPKRSKQEQRGRIIDASKEMADTEGPGLQGSVFWRSEERPSEIQSGFSGSVCNTASKRLPNWCGGEVEQPSPLTEFERPSGREIERDFRGMAHGIANRVDRLKLLGNGQVVQVVEWIGKRIIEYQAAYEAGVEKGREAR